MHLFTTINLIHHNMKRHKLQIARSSNSSKTYPSIVGARMSFRNSVESIFSGMDVGVEASVSSDSFFRIDLRFLLSSVSFDSELELRGLCDSWAERRFLFCCEGLSWCMVLPSDWDLVRLSVSMLCCESGISKLKLRVFITSSSSSSFCLSFRIFSFFTKGSPPYSGDKSSIDLESFIVKVV